MKIQICILLFSITAIGFTQGYQDNAREGLKPSLSFSLNSNGIASIPAFSLDKPAIVASVSLSKGRFSYDPVLAYSLEMKPWYIDNWLHYKIVRRPEFELRAGVNFSTFCSGFTVNGEDFLKAERYFAFALTGTYISSPVSLLSFDYWSDNGQEKGSLSGHFAAVTYERSDISFGKKIYSSLNAMLFYINYNGKNDGLFVSPTFSFSLRDNPTSVFFQATQVISTNISPWPGFRWNVGIKYNL